MILSAFSPHPLSFGDQELSDRMFQEQLMVSILVIFPLSVLIGQVCLRLASRCPLPFIRPDIWNAIVRLILSDLLIEMMQQSLTCVPFEDEDSIKELILQSFGYGCPLYAHTLDATATMKLFCMRIIALSLGIFIGEGWMPIAITGGISTGKSTVAKLLVDGGNDQQNDQQEGTEVDGKDDNDDDDAKQKDQTNANKKRVAVIEGGTVHLVDADKIGHDIILQSTAGNVYSKLVATFGADQILSDEKPEDDLDPPIDRARLGALIFKDPSLRKKLNSITHPRIIAKLLQKLAWGIFLTGTDLCLADIPLLFEAGFFLKRLFCLTICVTCTPEQELQRLQKRNPDLTKEQCQQRIASQMPVSKKAQMADLVVDNSGDEAALEGQVEELREQLMMRLYGVGLTLFQIVAIMGVSLPVAIYWKLYQHAQEQSDAGAAMDSGAAGAVMDDVPMDLSN